MKKILTSLYLPWIILGLLLRIFLSFSTQHPDIWGISLTPSFFANHGVLNIYDYLGHLDISTSDYAKNLGNTLNTADIFIYPPLAYFTLGILMLLLKPFYDVSYFNVVAANLEKTLGDPRLFQYLFLAKLPYMLFDFGALYFFYKMFKNNKSVQRIVFFLWLFNPVTIYASYMIGNFDIIPIFFTVVGLYFFIKQRDVLGFLFFGIGAAYKTYPILVAFPLLFYFGDTLKKKILYGTALVGPYILTSLPFLTTPEYRRDVLFNSKETKFLFMGLPVSGAEVVYVFIFGVTIICLAAAFHKKTRELFWIYPLSILLLFFSVTHYHPQWMSWMVPFIILPFAFYKQLRWPIVVLFLAYVGIVFFFESSLNVGIFGPLFPASHNMPGLADVLKGRFDVFELKSLMRSVSAGVAVWMIALLLFKKDLFLPHTSDETPTT